MIARALAGFLALAGAGWLAAGIPGARAEREAQRLVTAGDLAAARPRYADARRARPDVGVWPDEAGLRFTAGDAAGAERLLERTVAAEPENLGAWRLLAIVRDASDPRGAEAARARARALSPPR